MAKQNCWEVKNCGREPGGKNTVKIGACPASTQKFEDEINGGSKAGRICWAIAGTLCGGKVQGSFAQKRATCTECDFFKKVKEEEGNDFKMYPD